MFVHRLHETDDDVNAAFVRRHENSVSVSMSISELISTTKNRINVNRGRRKKEIPPPKSVLKMNRAGPKKKKCSHKESALNMNSPGRRKKRSQKKMISTNLFLAKIVH